MNDKSNLISAGRVLLLLVALSSFNSPVNSACAQAPPGGPARGGAAANKQNSCKSANDKDQTYASKLSHSAMMSSVMSRMASAKASPGYSMASTALTDFLKGGTQAAMREATQAIARDDKLAVAYAIRGVCYAEFDESKKVADDLSRALTLDPQLACLYFYDLRRQAYSDLQNYPAAIADTDRAIKYDATQAWRFRERGEFNLALHKNDLAVRDFSESVKLEPKNYDSYALRGNLFFQLGRYKEALADYNEAIHLNATDGRLYGCRADCYDKLGKPDQAKKDRAVCNKRGGSPGESEGLSDLLGK